MLTTERDALLENKKILKAQIEELKSTLQSKTTEFEESESDFSEKLKASSASLKVLQTQFESKTSECRDLQNISEERKAIIEKLEKEL